VPLCGGDNPNRNFGGHHFLKIWEGKSRSKLVSISNNLILTANVSKTKRAVKKWNSKWSTTANLLLNKKCEIRSTTIKVLLSHSDPPKVSTTRDFRQFYSLTGNISATDWDIKNFHSTSLLLGQKICWTFCVFCTC